MLGSQHFAYHLSHAMLAAMLLGPVLLAVVLLVIGAGEGVSAGKVIDKT